MYRLIHDTTAYSLLSLQDQRRRKSFDTSTAGRYTERMMEVIYTARPFDAARFTGTGFGTACQMPELSSHERLLRDTPQD